MKGGKHRNGRFVTNGYRYDPVAREMTCDFGGATNVYRYDADGKLLAVSVPGEGWATYSYNALGQNDAVTLPGGAKRMLSYDVFGRLSAQSVQDSGGNALLAQAYQRSLTGRLETKTTDAGVWKYGYDLTDQVTNAVLSASASTDGAWRYVYDAMGHQKSAKPKAKPTGDRDFEAARMRGARSRIRRRSGNCNRTQSAIGNGQSADVTAYAANRLNQYTAISNGQWAISSPTYDLNGNMTWDGTNAYFWDVQNQLVLVSNAAVQVASAYDAMGRRVRKIVSRRDAETQSWSVESTRHFFYDGWNLVAEIGSRSSEVSTNRYVWGNDLSGSLQGAGGVGGLLVVSTLPTAYCQLPIVSYPLYDHNGNVERYAARSGATVASYQYDAFGNTVSETVNGEPGTLNLPFRFSTKYWDAEVGLVMFQLRPYSPALGRWTSRDKIGELSGIGLLIALGNDLINDEDYLGLMSAHVWGDNLPGIGLVGPYNPNASPTIGPAPDRSSDFGGTGNSQPAGDSGLQFRYHGYWGGPGWAAGKEISECDLKEEDFKKGVWDVRDACYKGHDRCIWECCRDKNNPCITEEDQEKCMRKCDYKLAGCLLKVPPWSPSFYGTSRGAGILAPFEAGFFAIDIPFYFHGGWKVLF